MKQIIQTWRQKGVAMREMRREAKAPNRSHCQNCGTRLEGEYCYVCGQARKEPRRAVIGLVQDVFVETLAIDGKLFRTIALLLRAPGKLAKRYLDGQRVRYSPPFRLYLFASVFFFLAAFWSLDDWFDVNMDGEIDVSAEESAAGDAASEDTGPTVVVTEDDGAPVEDAPPDDAAVSDDVMAEAGKDGKPDSEDFSLTEALENGEVTSEYEWMIPYLEKIAEAFDRAQDDPRLFVAQARENLPRFLFLAPIVYAMSLMLLYIYRRRFFVYDHFVVSLYMHAALYAFLFVAIIISKLPIIGDLWGIPLIWGALQPILVQRQAYGSNWFSTIVKWFVINVTYWMAMLFILLAGLSYSLYVS